jgi:multicomponent Na+:H+ antiporter subunit G
MIVLQWLRFGMAALFLLAGLIPIVSAVVGLFRFRYVINRIHAAATLDTLAMLSVSISLMIMIGWNLSLLKIILIIAFLWFANPISGHLIARLEVITNPQIGKEYEVVRLERD